MPRWATVDDEGIVDESDDEVAIRDSFASSTNHVGDLLLVEIHERRR